MALTVGRWSTRGLFAAWAVYWAGLLLVGGRTLVRIIAFAVTAPKGHSSITAGIDGELVRLAALRDGQVVMGGTASLLSLALWIAGPPLALWAVWAAQRPRPGELAADQRAPLRPADRWTPTSYHETLRHETMREQERG